MWKELSLYKATAIPVGLPIGLILTAFLLVGCISTNYREDPKYVYQAYSGTQLPKKDVATVWWDKGGLIVNIDGHEFYICEDPYHCHFAKYYMGAYLLPGEHTFEFQIDCHACVPAVIRMKANLLPDHLYEFNFEYRYPARSHYDYAARLVDQTTGKLVAGRSPDVFEWTWLELEQALQRLDRDSATEKQVIELLSEPNDRMTDNTVVYVACKKSKWSYRPLE